MVVDTYRGTAGCIFLKEKLVPLRLISQGLSTKYSELMTSMSRPEVATTHPDQRKGSMEGNWATIGVNAVKRKMNTKIKKVIYLTLT